MFSNSYLYRIIWLLGNAKKKLPLLLLCVLVSSVFDVLGIGVIGPLMLATLNATGIDMSTYSIPVIGNYLLQFSPQEIGLAVLMIFGAKACIGCFLNFYVLQFAWYHRAKMSKKLMLHYMSMEYETFKLNNSSEYVYNMHAAVNQYVQHALLPLLRIISEGFVLVSITLLLLILYGKVFSFFLLLLLVVTLVYDRFVRKKNARYGRLTNENSVNALTYMREGMAEFRSVRIFGVENFFAKRVYTHIKLFSKYKLHAQLFATSVKYLLELLLVFFVAGIFIVSLFMDNPVTLLPAFATIGVAVVRIIPMINIILRSFASIQFGKNSTDRLYNALKIKVQGQPLNLMESKFEITSQDKKGTAIINISHATPIIEFQNVNFNYDNKGASLNNINFSINKNEIVGISGKSGAGKSTLVDLILGFLKAKSGKILIAGEPIDEVLVCWRKMVAYIPQSTSIRDASVVENIAFGLERNQVDEDKVCRVIKQSLLDNLFQNMPDDLNITLGEKGGSLSGGQKQRIALARALYYDRDIFILDEATNALDSLTESKVMTLLQDICKTKTIIIIAHNPETLKVCNKILAVQNGSVKEISQTNSDAKEISTHYRNP